VRLKVVAAGKLREPNLRAAADDYLSRLRRYLPAEVVEVVGSPPAKMARAMIRALPESHELWVLDPAGKQPTSPELARWLGDRMDQGTKGIAFVIGAAEGVPHEVLARAQRRVSLSRLTLPHRLARIFLLEQLYRSMTILRGEPYSK
jgi:23S rRNA (pseudouridine1915-N3)-methyltransferase